MSFVPVIVETITNPRCRDLAEEDLLPLRTNWMSLLRGMILDYTGKRTALLGDQTPQRGEAWEMGWADARGIRFYIFFCANRTTTDIFFTPSAHSIHGME